MKYTTLLNVVNKLEIFSGFCYTPVTTFQKPTAFCMPIARLNSLEAIASATLGRVRRRIGSYTTASVKAGWSQEEDVFPVC